MQKIHGISKSRPDSILSGKLLRLRDGLYKQLRDREWVFNKVENDLIFLIHKNGAFGVVVRMEDIEWSEC